MIANLLLPFAMATALQGAPVPAEPPMAILFGFYRIKSFHDRADDLRCNHPDRSEADAQYKALRERLIARYGDKFFSPKRSPSGGPGECQTVLMVYRTNLAEYRAVVEAELAKSSTTAKNPE